MALADSIRAKAFGLVRRLPGKAGELALKANEALGRPLADEHELADRRQFAAGRGNVTVVAQPAPKPDREQAPVIVYFVDRKEQKREVRKLTDILEANGIVYTVTDIQEDPAAQFAVKRDSGGRLPAVFVAGECIGGREQLVNAAASGELTKKVFG